MRGVTGITPEKVKGSVYLGGGGTTPIFTRAVDLELIQGFNELSGDFSETETFPEKQYLSFDPSRSPSFPNKLSQEQKEKFQEWTGLSWDQFLTMYKPKLLAGKRDSNVRLYFINDEGQTGDGQARIYYEEFYVDRDEKNKVKTFLLASPKTQKRPEILANIHPALKEIVGSNPRDHHVAISAEPSGDYPEIHQQEMLYAYMAMGVPESQIDFLRGKIEEERLQIIGRATIIDVSGGNQRPFVRTMEGMPSVIQTVINRVKQGLSAIFTTSASCAALGRYMIAGTGDNETDPLSVSRYNVKKCGTWVVTGLGVLEGIFTDTHLLGPKKYCDQSGQCDVSETGRDRVSRFLAALLSLTELYGISQNDLPLGLAPTEGTFGEIKQSILRVVSNHDLGGVYVINLKKIFDVHFKITGQDRDKVVTLTSAKARKHGVTEPTELIWDKETQKRKGSSGCYLTTASIGRKHHPNAFDGVGMLWNGEILNLKTMELQVVRYDRWIENGEQHSFPLAEGCRFIDEYGNDVNEQVAASYYNSNDRRL